MTLLTILYLLFLHWVADFLFQTTDMATNKWHSFVKLLEHVATYTIVLMIGSVFLLELDPLELLIFAGVSFWVHLVQDFITSKLVHRQFEHKIYNGWVGAFTIIGLDQFLHFVQLFGTFYYLTTS